MSVAPSDLQSISLAVLRTVRNSGMSDVDCAVLLLDIAGILAVECRCPSEIFVNAAKSAFGRALEFEQAGGLQ